MVGNKVAPLDATKIGFHLLEHCQAAVVPLIVGLPDARSGVSDGVVRVAMPATARAPCGQPDR